MAMPNEPTDDLNGCIERLIDKAKALAVEEIVLWLWQKARIYREIPARHGLSIEIDRLANSIANRHYLIDLQVHEPKP
jgi:hypothetical protein